MKILKYILSFIAGFCLPLIFYWNPKILGLEPARRLLISVLNASNNGYFSLLMFFVSLAVLPFIFQRNKVRAVLFDIGLLIGSFYTFYLLMQTAKIIGP